MEITAEGTRWRKSPIFPERYWVSDKGEVYSVVMKKVLKSVPDKDGYHYLTLAQNYKHKTIKVHRLVALAFIPNPEGKPQIDHIDGNKTNNAVGNLRWATQKENCFNPVTLPRFMEHARELYKYPRKPSPHAFGRIPVVLRWADGREEQFPSIKASAKAAGFSAGYMHEILRGRKRQKAAFTIRLA